LYSINSTTPSK